MMDARNFDFDEEKTKHTKEPWYVEKPFKDLYGNVKDDETWISANNRRDEWHGLAVSFSTPNCRGVDKANARRIVACVNACKGISTEKLERGVIKEAMDMVDRLSREITALPTDCSGQNCAACANPCEKYIESLR